jgi:hypothetical protein
MKAFYKIIGLVVLIAVAYVFYENFNEKKVREAKGIGIEIHPDTGFYCKPPKIDVQSLHTNQTFELEIFNEGEIGSVKESLVPPGTRLKAKVVAVEKSSSLGKKIFIFEFTHIVVGAKSYKFDGYISPDSNRPSDSLRNDGRFLGSFAGMGAGGGGVGVFGIVGGFILGDKAISTIRRHTDCPLNFMIAPGFTDDTIIHVRAYKPAFITLGVNPPEQKSANNANWFAKIVDFFS